MLTQGFILAGGAGTRLWPMSRRERPKQFLPLFGEQTMLELTVKRLQAVVPKENCTIIIDADYAPIIHAEYPALQIMGEPCGKNTAPAILWAALKTCKEAGEDSVMVILPADHLVQNTKGFETALQTAVEQAKKGYIVTFGIVPTRPETGYGYIQGSTSGCYDANKTLCKVTTFKEKPDYAKACEYLASGNFFWNSGMFVCHVGTLLEEFAHHCPDMMQRFADIDPTNPAQIAEAYAQTTPISIDFAVMEQTQKAYMVISEFGWSDVGSFKSIHEQSTKDTQGNALCAQGMQEDCKNCLVLSTSQRPVVAVGLENIAVVDTKEAVMVMNMDKTEALSKLVHRLKEEYK